MRNSRNVEQGLGTGPGGRINVAVGCALLAVALVSASCSSREPTRPAQSRASLVAARDKLDERMRDNQDAAIERNLARVKSDVDEHAAGRAAAPPVVNLLIVSGGGDWGAFGAGFLKGWGTVPPGDMARPKFDAVTGVSTGALIAPFAFLGDEASIEKLVVLYRNPKKDWVKPRGLLSLVSGGAAYADLPGLERELREALDLPMLQRIVDAGATGRILAVSATNIDAEEIYVWDVIAEARRGVERHDTEPVRQILLASSAIPGAFPPRAIDGGLFVDGGITGNILYGGRGARRDSDDSFVAQWRSAYPGVPIPKIRYWILFNNEVRWPPEVVQPKWSSVLLKSSTASTRSATLNSIRQLFLQARLAKLEYGADIEVRFAAVPDGWLPPTPGPFQKKTMNALADLGEQMGADPSGWRTEPP